MKRFLDLDTSEKALFNEEIDFSKLPQIMGELRTDRILKMNGLVSNFMSQIQEEEKLIILIDIVGFSKDSTRNQVYKIYLFQRYLMSKVLNNKIATRGKIKVSHFVPTGDGCYIVAEKCDEETALTFLVSIITGFKSIKTENGISMSLRISALFGTVVPFFDMAHHLNYIGEGMNEASRILSGGQKILEEGFLNELYEKKAEKENESRKDSFNGENKNGYSEEDVLKSKIYSRNSLYLGDSLKNAASSFFDYCTKILYFPNVPDKHGIKRNITVLQGI